MGPVRTEVMWQSVLDAVALAGGSGAALDILDLGGGTGGDAVRLALAGHRVTVVDPSPDALASLHRRSVEDGVEGTVAGILGDAADLASHVPAKSFDLVLCHGVLEYVDDPGQALAAIALVLRPGGLVSIVVASRHSAVFARALAGDFEKAESLFAASAQDWNLRADGPRKYVLAEINDLLSAHRLTVIDTNALRVFADLVPSALVDSEPGARARLYALEKAVKKSPEFAALSAGLQSIARLDLTSEQPDRGGNSAAL
ncbi:MAG: methyltransferase domain-containing protein [Aeromicrobium sp.]